MTKTGGQAGSVAMTTEVRDELIRDQLAHIGAARRLRAAMREYGRLRGLERLAQEHIARAGTLAMEICSAGRLQAPAEAYGT